MQPRWARLFFTGKTGVAGAWQIYEADSVEAAADQLTADEGGAMNPAYCQAATSSSARRSRKLGEPGPSARSLRPGRGGSRSADLWRARPPSIRRPARRPDSLRFGARGSAGEVCSRSACSRSTAMAPNFALSPWITTVPFVRRPRELADGRVAFLAGHSRSAATAARDGAQGRPLPAGRR